MDLPTALTAAKATFELLTGAVAARDQGKVNEATLQLRQQLFDMSDIALSYVTKNAELAAAVADLTTKHAELGRSHAELADRLRERESYLLEEVDPGAFAYGYQPPAEGVHKPKHYLCQACYDSGIKVVLQLVPAKTGSHPFFKCVSEPKHNVVLHSQAPKPMPVRRTLGHF